MNMRIIRDSTVRLLAACLGALLLGGCSQGLLSNRLSNLTLMSTAHEQELGAQSHPRIVARHGGVYRNARLEAKLKDMVDRLVRASRQPDLTYRLTILDTPMVNAFALPGGYLYVTRGLLALANDEAELAGVLAHELGHITARHTAKRRSKELGASLFGLGGLWRGVFMGEREARAYRAALASELAKYSREQEYEADRLGIVTASRAGFNPLGAATFLKSLAARARFLARLNVDGAASIDAPLSTSHPATVQRIARAHAQATALGAVAKTAPRHRARYLKMIDGLSFGPKSDSGVIRSGVFLHAGFQFAFNVPAGFRLYNARQTLLGFGPRDSLMFFDTIKLSPSVALENYVREGLTGGPAHREIKSFRINDMAAVAAQTTNRGYHIRVFAIRYGGNRVYRFFFALRPETTAALSPKIEDAVRSFRQLSPRDARKIKPRRIKTIAVSARDTVASLARRMDVEGDRVQWFRTLNGLAPGVRVKAGDKVKIVTR